jgi:hypothetical protein
MSSGATSGGVSSPYVPEVAGLAAHDVGQQDDGAAGQAAQQPGQGGQRGGVDDQRVDVGPLQHGPGALGREPGVQRHEGGAGAQRGGDAQVGGLAALGEDAHAAGPAAGRLDQPGGPPSGGGRRLLVAVVAAADGQSDAFGQDARVVEEAGTQARMQCCGHVDPTHR